MNEKGDKNQTNESITNREVLNNEHNKHIHREVAQSNRRSLLQGTAGAIGATLASSLGLSTKASARKSPDHEIAKTAAAEYDSPERIRGAVRKHGSELLRTLVDCGHLESSAVADLELEALYTSSMSEYFAADEAAATFGQVDAGEPRTSIQIKRQTSDGKELIMVIKPQVGDSYAVIPNTSGDGAISIRDEDDDTGGESTPCGCYCSDVSRQCAVACVGGECNCLQYNKCAYGGCSCCWTETGCTTSTCQSDPYCQ